MWWRQAPDPRAVDALREEAEAALDDGDLARAAKLARRLAKLAPRDPRARALEAEVLLEHGDVRGAADAARVALAAGADDPAILEVGADALIEALALDEARSWLAPRVDERRGTPRLRFLLGVLLERAGEGERARALYRSAERADAAYRFVAPTSRVRFDATVERVLGDLPGDLTSALGRLPVLVADFPTADELAGSEPPLSPFILGLFSGPTLAEERSGESFGLGPTVTLYQRNLELTCRTRGELERQTRITLIHEIGHFLGLDEDDLADRGLE